MKVRQKAYVKKTVNTGNKVILEKVVKDKTVGFNSKAVFKVFVRKVVISTKSLEVLIGQENYQTDNDMKEEGLINKVGKLEVIGKKLHKVF